MPIKRLFIVLFALALLPTGPAFAEPEPDNWIWQATGPITNGQFSGTIPSDNDNDWYMFYAASQTQLTITLAPNACPSYLAFYGTNGGSRIDGTAGSTTTPRTITYTTALGTNRYFIRMYEYSDSCQTDAYSVSMTPVSGLMSGPPMPTATTSTGEPNESAAQAWGPLAGDTIYTGTLETQNDVDWLYFYASAAFDLTAISSTECDGYARLRSSNEGYGTISGTGYTYNSYSHLTFTPAEWKRYYLEMTGNTGCTWRISISPASAIQSGPAPVTPAPTPPSAMAGLTYRKTKRAVVVYWPAITGATSYQIRTIKGSKVSGWSPTTSTWKSYKKKSIPRKKGMRVEVQPLNDVGAGTSQVIRVKR